MSDHHFNAKFVLSTKFSNYLIYILDTFGESFGCGFLATARNIKKFLAFAKHGQPNGSENLLIRDSGGYYRMWLFWVASHR